MPEGSEEDWIPSLPTIPAVDTDAIYEKLDQELLKKRLEPRLEPFLPQIPEKEPFNDDEDFYDASENGEHENGEYPIVDTVDGEREDDLADLPPLDLPPGRSVLMPTQDDGQRFRAQILERVQEFNKGLDTERNENPMYRVLVGHDGGEKWEELVAYNDLVTLVDDEADSDGLWRFRSIKSHQGPLLPSDPKYKGSRWNVFVEWETGEITCEPLNAVEHDKAVCASYARKHGLLDEPGWKQFKRHAKREKTLIRMVNQAKLHSFRTAPVYQHGYLVPRNHDQAVELDLKNNNTKWQDAEKLELNAILDYNSFDDKGRFAPAPAGHKRVVIR